jgi:hypothetical protein
MSLSKTIDNNAHYERVKLTDDDQLPISASVSSASLKRDDSVASMSSIGSGVDPDTELAMERQGTCSVPLFKVIHLSIGFLLLHIAYSPVAVSVCSHTEHSFIIRECFERNANDGRKSIRSLFSFCFSCVINSSMSSSLVSLSTIGILIRYFSRFIVSVRHTKVACRLALQWSS